VTLCGWQIPDTGIIAKSPHHGRVPGVMVKWVYRVHLELGKAGLSLQSVLEHEPGAKPADPMQPYGVYARSIIAGSQWAAQAPRGDWA